MRLRHPELFKELTKENELPSLPCHLTKASMKELIKHSSFTPEEALTVISMTRTSICNELIQTLNNNQLVSLAITSDNEVFVSEILRRGVCAATAIRQSEWAKIFPPKKLIASLTSSS